MMLRDIKPGQKFVVVRTGQVYTRLSNKGDMANIQISCVRHGKTRRRVILNYQNHVSLVEGKQDGSRVSSNKNK